MEEWRSIPGYEKYYEISSEGRVRSFDRIVASGRLRRGRTLSQAVVTGYMQVCLCVLGESKKFYTHVLVALSFIGSKPDGLEVNHKDGNKSNNSVDNLEYITPSANMDHSYRSGLHFAMRGENNPFAKLTEGDVRKIRAMRESGEKVSSISKVMGISTTHVKYIVSRKAWSHIE